jgi:hypothetical protein
MDTERLTSNKTDLFMKDYESGFLALILAGILMMVIGLGLMVSAARSPNEARAALGQRSSAPPSILAMRIPTERGALLRDR